MRNKDNIARVRRDEAQAREEEEERQRRVDLAEQEARMQILRQRASKSQGESSEAAQTGAVARAAEPLEHVNFFAEAEAGIKSASLKNKEHEAEKKMEREKLEKQIGILTYLGQSSAEVVGKSWYDQTTEERRHVEDVKAKKSEKHKRAQDPLHRMNDYLRKKEERRRRRDEKEDRLSEHRDHRRHRHRHRGSHTMSSSVDGASSPQQLRQERLQREQRERQRAEALLAKSRGEKSPDRTEEMLTGRYSSQYNPHLARQNRMQPY